MGRKNVEAPAVEGDSPAGDASPLAPPAGSFLRLGRAAVEPGPAEVMQMLVDVQDGCQRAFDDLLDAAYWVDKVQAGSVYEVGLIRRCAETVRELMTTWMRRCESEARRRAP